MSTPVAVSGAVPSTAGRSGPLVSLTGHGEDSAAAGEFATLLALLVPGASGEPTPDSVDPDESGQPATGEAVVGEVGDAVPASAAGLVAVVPAVPATPAAASAVPDASDGTLPAGLLSDSTAAPDEAGTTPRLTTPPGTPPTGSGPTSVAPVGTPVATPGSVPTATVPAAGATGLPAEAAPPASSTPAASTPEAATGPTTTTPATTGAVAAGAVTVDAAAAPERAAVLEQVGRVLEAQVGRAVQRGDGTQRLTLTLYPATLGEVQVTLTVRGGEVQVHLAASGSAQAALADDGGALHRLLERAGAGTTRLTVGELGTTAPVRVDAPVVTAPAQAAAASADPADQQPGAQHGEQADSQDRDARDAADTGRHTDHQHAGTRGGDTFAKDGSREGTGTAGPPHDPATRTRPGVDVTM